MSAYDSWRVYSGSGRDKYSSYLHDELADPGPLDRQRVQKPRFEFGQLRQCWFRAMVAILVGPYQLSLLNQLLSQSNATTALRH